MSFNRGTLVGLIGANIQLSLSPALPEDAFRATGRRGYYHLIDTGRVGRRSLYDLLVAARRLGFRGLNVTHPCKEAVLPMLDAVSDEAAQIGAVNTIAIDADGRMAGFNTDRIGFRRSFGDGFGIAATADRTALLLGASGADRALAFALMDMDVAELAVFDAEAARAGLPAADIGRHFPDRRRHALTELQSLAGFSGIANATPAGCLAVPAIRCRPGGRGRNTGSPTSSTRRWKPRCSEPRVRPGRANRRVAACWCTRRPSPPASSLARGPISPGSSARSRPHLRCATPDGHRPTDEDVMISYHRNDLHGQRSQSMQYAAMPSWLRLYTSVFAMDKALQQDVTDPGGLVKSQVVQTADGAARRSSSQGSAGCAAPRRVAPSRISGYPPSRQQAAQSPQSRHSDLP